MLMESSPTIRRSTIPAAVHSLHSGKPVVLSDRDRTRGEMVYPAQSIDTARMADLIRHTSGLVQVAMPDTVCDELMLPPMAGAGRYGSQQCVTTDMCGVGTGISATDRAATVRALADVTATSASFVRPGHVIPVRVPDTADVQLPGDFAACALRLIRLAGFRPAAVMATIVDAINGIHLAEGVELDRFARRYGFELVDVDFEDLDLARPQIARH